MGETVIFSDENGSEDEYRVHHVATVIDETYTSAAYLYVVLR
jgi:hypothetical protein